MVRSSGSPTRRPKKATSATIPTREREEDRAQWQPEADGQEPERVVGDREVCGQPQPEEVAAPAMPLRERDVLDGVRFERPHPIAISRGCHAHPSCPTRARRANGRGVRSDPTPGGDGRRQWCALGDHSTPSSTSSSRGDDASGPHRASNAWSGPGSRLLGRSPQKDAPFAGLAARAAPGLRLCALHDLQQLRHGRREPRALFRQPDPGLRGLPLGAGIHPLSVGSDPRRRPQPEIVALRGGSSSRGTLPSRIDARSVGS